MKISFLNQNVVNHQNHRSNFGWRGKVLENWIEIGGRIFSIFFWLMSPGFWMVECRNGLQSGGSEGLGLSGHAKKREKLLLAHKTKFVSNFIVHFYNFK